MGSGHFVVAIFERMVALRMAEESGMEKSDAIAAVIGENLFGLEIDPRCTQIAAFNLALSAWRQVGHCALPPMNLACSGIAPNAKREDWLLLAGDDDRLRNGMDALYSAFQEAPELGSLINPLAPEGDLLKADFNELQPLLSEALRQEAKNDLSLELRVSALGIARAAGILGGRFTLVATNVPYLGRLKQANSLRNFCERWYPDSKTDLATCFLERLLMFCESGGTMASVVPQSTLFLQTYSRLRQRLLARNEWCLVARLGSRAFETIGGEVVSVSLLVLNRTPPEQRQLTAGIDVSALPSPAAKKLGLSLDDTLTIHQSVQLQNPDAIITFSESSGHQLLSTYADSLQGACTLDIERFRLNFWELPSVLKGWMPHVSSPAGGTPYSGMHYVSQLREQGTAFYSLVLDMKRDGSLGGCWQAGRQAWGHRGVACAWMGSLPVAIYLGQIFDNSIAVIVPKDPSHLPAIYCYCSSPDYLKEVRKINQKTQVANTTLAKVPFDLKYWLERAAEQFPHGLPQPFSADPTEGLFDGQPKTSSSVLHVAIARLLGYRWPRQTGTSLPDCPALDSDGLATLADVDGIICLSATKGEPAAAERLRGLLAQEYGEDWNSSVQQELLAQVGYAGKTLDDWLRDGFFEQHCSLFHHRPFIWHIWDGNKNGFSALVNYHKLNYATLESLTYSYLGLWTQRQQAAVDAGEAGSDARLQAAKQLQSKLKLILEGEPPYDLSVRWKPLSQQAIGWHLDLNDGVRMNIRPFATADILRKRVKIKWDKDRGKEPVREQKDFPWFWGWDGKTQDFAGAGTEPDGNRWNDLHYTNEAKRKARGE